MNTTITTIILLVFLSSTSAFSFANDTRSQLLRAADKKASGKYVRQDFLKWVNVPFNLANKQKKALIIGDSHAQDFFNSIQESHALTQYQIRVRYIPTGCQPVIGDDITQFIQAKDKASCATADNLYLAKEQIAQSDVVILVANWKEWSATQLPKTIKNLQLSPKQKLIIIGRKSFGKISIRRYLRMPEKKLLSLRNKPDAVQIKINALMKNTLSPNIFIDLQHIICHSQTTCPIFTKDLALISFDGGHLTKEGAKYMGQQLLKNSILSQL